MNTANPWVVARVFQCEGAGWQDVNIRTLDRARKLMDAFLAVGWWRIDWYQVSGTYQHDLIATVRYNESDELDPVIMEVLR